jgi:hypothetical protein
MLTIEQVQYVRIAYLYVDPEDRRERRAFFCRTAEQFNCSSKCIEDIINGRTWVKNTELDEEPGLARSVAKMMALDPFNLFDIE